MNKTPAGITPPAPGLDREEPDFWVEEDIPSDDGQPAARASEGSAAREERPRKADRE